MKDSTKRAIEEIERLANLARRNPRAKGNLKKELQATFDRLVAEAVETVKAHGEEYRIPFGPDHYTIEFHGGRIETWGNGYLRLADLIEDEEDFERKVCWLRDGVQKKLKELGVKTAA